MIKAHKISILTLMIIFLGSCRGNSSFNSESTSEDAFGPPLINFSVSSPIVLEANAQIKIAGTFNEWNPDATGYALDKQSDYEYEIVLTFTEGDIGSFIEYKYVLLFDEQLENSWTYVEGTSTGGETTNRRYQIKQGVQSVNDDIQSFKNNTGKTSVTRGSLQIIELDMPQYADGRKRHIRIWLPDGYNPVDTNTKYPVLYMHDGQNLFDLYTSFAGEWRIDESLGTLMDDGYAGSIVVGIDNSNDRLNELSPSWPIGSAAYQTLLDNPSGEKYAAFVVETVKPYIDAHYNTNSGATTTGIGGSSMGGVMSFYMAMNYPNIFGYALIFSSAMQIYEENTSADFLAEFDFSSGTWPRMYLYAGGLEPTITPYVQIMKDELIAKGYPSDNINSHIDTNKGHNESAWAQYFPVAYRWLVGLQ